MAVPMGMIADSKSRTKVAGAGIALWSLVTTLCGLSQNFFQILLCRTGIGIGEATLTPASYPIIKSLFQSKRLSTAIGIYSSGIYIGSGLAYWLGGGTLNFISAHHMVQQLGWVKYDWQLVFLLFGIPGMILSICMYCIKAPDQIYSSKKFNLKDFNMFLKALSLSLCQTYHSQRLIQCSCNTPPGFGCLPIYRERNI